MRTMAINHAINTTFTEPKF